MIKALKELTYSLDDNEIVNDVIQQSARFNNYKKQDIKGITDCETLNRHSAQITYALSSIIDTLPDGDVEQRLISKPSPPVAYPDKQWLKELLREMKAASSVLIELEK